MPHSPQLPLEAAPKWLGEDPTSGCIHQQQQCWLLEFKGIMRPSIRGVRTRNRCRYSDLAKDWAAREISKQVDYFAVIKIKKGGAWLLGEIGDPVGLASLNAITAPELKTIIGQAISKIAKRPQ
jgi:hypothetical protein